MAVKKAIVLLS